MVQRSRYRTLLVSAGCNWMLTVQSSVAWSALHRGWSSAPRSPLRQSIACNFYRILRGKKQRQRSKGSAIFETTQFDHLAPAEANFLGTPLAATSVRNNSSSNAVPTVPSGIKVANNFDEAASRTGNSQSKRWWPRLRREMMAECFGTWLLVFLGSGSNMSAVFTDSLHSLFQIAAVWMLIITVTVSSLGHISGAHINPAISLAIALVRPTTRYNWRKLFFYVLAQLTGAITASAAGFMLYAGQIAAFEARHDIVRSSTNAVVSAKVFGQYFSAPVTTGQAFLTEALGTMILTAVIFCLTHPNNKTTRQSPMLVPPLIGATVGALICVMAPLTQAGFNPARDFGPRIVAYAAGWKAVAFRQWWVYVVAPCIGAPLGALIADRVVMIGDDDDDLDF